MADVISEVTVTLVFSNGRVVEQDLTKLVKGKNVTIPVLTGTLVHIGYPPITRMSPLVLCLRASGISAMARMEGEGTFVVLAGSYAAKGPFLELSNANQRLRKEMLSDGRLVEKDHSCLLTQDAKFSSPSGAANFLVGYSINGKRAWRGIDGRTLGAIERQLKAK